jgi:hypothetical protein
MPIVNQLAMCEECTDQTCAKCKRFKRNAKARENRKARDEAMRSCGLVKVRGALGGTYWE